MINPVGDPLASWQWKTRLGGGGATALIGDVNIWGVIGSWSCPLVPFMIDPLIPFVGEFAFDFFLNIFFNSSLAQFLSNNSPLLARDTFTRSFSFQLFLCLLLFSNWRDFLSFFLLFARLNFSLNFDFSSHDKSPTNTLEEFRFTSIFPSNYNSIKL